MLAVRGGQCRWHSTTLAWPWRSAH
jgi:hypothetical protein